ncbi:hypothetical protein SDC9_83281 [bioreactor metagenome]|uniref:Uncharacterized protein n=1 Tax=bioreactor metagenome TaxID=1076179 RepID=A0A644Z9M2_9ZZZZ
MQHDALGPQGDWLAIGLVVLAFAALRLLHSEHRHFLLLPFVDIVSRVQPLSLNLLTHEGNDVTHAPAPPPPGNPGPTV